MNPKRTKDEGSWELSPNHRPKTRCLRFQGKHLVDLAGQTRTVLCIGLAFVALVLGALHGGQESQDEALPGGTAVKEVLTKIDDPSFDREGALMEAAGAGDLPTVRLLLNYGVDPYTTIDETQRTPLHEAAASGQVEVVKALIQAAREKGQLKWAVDAMDEEYQTPLLYAVLHGHTAVAGILLEHGVLIDAGGPDRIRPLHHAVLHRDEAMVELLLAKGAFVLARDAEGRTAEDYARSLRYHELSRRLEEATRRYWETPMVRQLRTTVERYLDALAAGDVVTARQFSTERHRKVLGDSLDPVTFQRDILDIERHEEEARVIVRITTTNSLIPFLCLIELAQSEEGWRVIRTTYRFLEQWEDIE